MPVVEKLAHLGILRSKSKEKTEATHIEQNITKARRTAYKLYLNRSCHFQLIHQIVRLISYLDYYQ